jgi:hypothetical protein
MDNMIVPFNKRAILPMLLPVYIALFDKELHDVSLREMRRNIQDMLDKNTRLSEPDGHDGIRKKPKGVFPAPLPPKRSRSPNFKRPRRENDTSEA